MSVTRPFDSSPALFYKWFIVTMHPSCSVVEMWHLKDNGVTTLTFWGQVTSSVTWPFDSRWSTFYGWSVVTMHLFCTIMEIWRFKCWMHTCGHGKKDGRREKERGSWRGREGKKKEGIERGRRRERGRKRKKGKVERGGRKERWKGKEKEEGKGKMGKGKKGNEREEEDWRKIA